MVPRAFLKLLLEKHYQVVVLEELADIHALVVRVLGVVLNHLVLYQVSLVVEVEPVQKGVFFQGPCKGVNRLESILLPVLVNERQHQVYFLYIAKPIQIL